MRIRSLLFVFLLLLAACGDDGESGSSTALPELLPLHATRGAAPGIFDSEGRQVLLHSMNLNSLGDYFQGNPAYPQVIPINDRDLPRMASFGLNGVRLILSWSSVEPQRGQFDEAYMERVRRAVATAKAAGVYVVLDMHQDAWGKYIASPPGTTCPAGREPAIGWDGAPEWATITDNRSTCRSAGVRELAPAVSTAFASFYDDRDGIQTELVHAWAFVAAHFAKEPAVAGYDLLNEPHFGAALVGSTPKLASYSAHAINAIRTAERQAGGFSHIVFFEPIALFPVTGTAPDPSFTDDTNIVYAPHNYAESITGLNSLTIEQLFARASEDAATYGTTLWIGEYGWFGDAGNNKARLIRYAREEDRLLISSAWWQWKQACGDPHSIGSTGGTPPSHLTHFLYSSCPGDVDLEPVPEWAAIVSRPFPRAAPGHIKSLESDGDAATMRVQGEGVGTLDLWVPARGERTPVVTGGGAVTLVPVEGGYRALVSVSGQYDVQVR